MGRILLHGAVSILVASTPNDHVGLLAEEGRLRPCVLVPSDTTTWLLLLLPNFVSHETQLRIRLLPKVMALDLWRLVDGVRFGTASDDTLEPTIRACLVV